MDMPPPIFLIERIDVDSDGEEFHSIVTYRATRESALRAMQELLAEAGRKGLTYGGSLEGWGASTDIYPRFEIVEVPYVEPEPLTAQEELDTTLVSPEFMDSLIKAGQS